MKLRMIVMIVLLFILAYIFYKLFGDISSSNEENYMANLQKLMNVKDNLPEKEKTIDAQNLNPSTHTTDKKDFMKLINRLKKYTEEPLKKIKMPVYFINMDKNPDRREFMENQLSKFCEKFSRIKGFNGYKIKNKMEDTVDGISFVNHYKNLSNSEIGCLMSHIIAIKTSYENGDDISIILEDDTIINLINLLEFDFEDIYKDAPYDWEIINLFHMSNWQIELLKFSYNRTKEYKYLRHDKPNYLYSAVGYIINRNGMKKIVDFFQRGKNEYELGKNLNVAPNGLADFIIYDLTNSYYLYPDLFYPNNLLLESTLHSDHTDSHIKRSLEVVKYYDDKIKRKDLFKKYNINVIYSNTEWRRDLKEKMENQFLGFPKVYRIDSEYNFDNKNLSVLKNHIKMLTYAMEKDDIKGQDVIICQDDISLGDISKELSRYQEKMGNEDPVNSIKLFLYDFYEKKIEWDVLMFLHSSHQIIPTMYKDIGRTYESKDSRCYLIRGGYVGKLLNTLKDSLAIYERLGIWNDMTNSVDEVWKPLQKVDRWYVPN